MGALPLVGPDRKPRKPAFLRLDLEALRELPRKLSWMDWVWLSGELLVANPIVITCDGWTFSARCCAVC